MRPPALFQFQDATGARISFLSPVRRESDEMVVHVVGEKTLEQELRFPVSAQFRGSFFAERRPPLTPTPAALARGERASGRANARASGNDCT